MMHRVSNERIIRLGLGCLTPTITRDFCKHVGESDPNDNSKANSHCEEKGREEKGSLGELCDALKLEAQFSFVISGVEFIDAVGGPIFWLHLGINFQK